MFKTSLSATAVLAASIMCTAQAEAGTITKFFNFPISCLTGSCTVMMPPPPGSSGTITIKGITCTWTSGEVNKAEFVVLDKYSLVKTYTIPVLINDLRQSFAWWPFSQKATLALAIYQLALEFKSETAVALRGDCYVAY